MLSVRLSSAGIRENTDLKLNEFVLVIILPFVLTLIHQSLNFARITCRAVAQLFENVL